MGETLVPFGRYQLGERVGAGGMAEVFRAVLTGEQGFRRVVAVKRILPHLGSEKTFVDQFLDEARIGSMLHHANLVHVLDFGTEAGRHFVAMEYVRGRSLAHVLARAQQSRQRLPLAFGVYTVREALLGLHHAHTRVDAEGRSLGIVHRDVSPQNILIGFDGDVRLADFGIARAVLRATLTEPGIVKGKAAYLAPELIEGTVADARADVYAMGVVLWEVLAGRQMFPASTPPLALAVAAAEGSHPRLKDVVDVPDTLAAAVHRALAPDPAARFATALQMAEVLSLELPRMAAVYSSAHHASTMDGLFHDEAKAEEAACAALESPEAVTPPAAPQAAPQDAPQAAGGSARTQAWHAAPPGGDVERPAPPPPPRAPGPLTDLHRPVTGVWMKPWAPGDPSPAPTAPPRDPVLAPALPSTLELAYPVHLAKVRPQPRAPDPEPAQPQEAPQVQVVATEQRARSLWFGLVAATLLLTALVVYLLPGRQEPVRRVGVRPPGPPPAAASRPAAPPRLPECHRAGKTVAYSYKLNGQDTVTDDAAEIPVDVLDRVRCIE